MKITKDTFGTEKERIISCILMTILLIACIYLFLYPTMPIKIEFEADGNFSIPQTDSGVKLQVTHISGKVETKIPVLMLTTFMRALSYMQPDFGEVTYL